MDIPNTIQTIGDTRELVFDINAVFKNLYGYEPIKFNTTAYQAKQGASQPNDARLTTFTKKTSTKWGSQLYGASDLFGREVFCPIIITCNKIDYTFPHAVISLKAPVIYKETPMTERGGSVIEEVALGAIRMTVKGFLVGAYGQFPDEEIDALATLRSSKSPKYLKSPLTDRFLIKCDTVIMLDLDMPSKGGFEGIKPFSFDLIEDSILQLYKVKS